MLHRGGGGVWWSHILQLRMCNETGNTFKRINMKSSFSWTPLETTNVVLDEPMNRLSNTTEF